jgi:hypothetical protein
VSARRPRVRSAGLLSRLPLGGSRASHHRRGRAKGDVGGCAHADGAPAAWTVALRGAPDRGTAGVARLDSVRSAERYRTGIVGTMSNPARPGEHERSACSDAVAVDCCRLLKLVGVGDHDRGFPVRRPSGPPRLVPRAAQRRTIGAGARRTIGGLRPRRWRAGGLHRGLERCTGSRCRVGCPVRHCAERGALPDGRHRHNVKPGTPR